MNDIVARVRSLLSSNGYFIAIAGVSAISLVAAVWIAVPARRQSAVLAAEAGRLQGEIDASNSWVTGFTPASSQELAAWQNAESDVQSLGVQPSERIDHLGLSSIAGFRL